MSLEAIGLLELQSIAWGMETADAMIKAAPVQLLDTFMVTPGKYVVIVQGDPSSVESSLRAGKESAAGHLLDSVLIPFVHPQVFPAVRGESRVEALGAVGLVETSSVASGILAADAAAKAADVQLLDLHLARGIGGKSMLSLTGQLFAVQAAVDAAAALVEGTNHLVATRIIANPHPDWAARLLGQRRPPAPGASEERSPDPNRPA